MRRKRPATSLAVESLAPARLVVPIGIAIIVMTTLTSARLSDLSLALLWGAIHLVTLLLAGIPIFGVKRLLIRFGNDSVSLPLIVFLGVVTGVIKALLTAGTEGALELTQDWTDNLALRVSGASLAGVWVLTFSAYVDRGLRKLEAARRALVESNVATRLGSEFRPPRLELQEPFELLSALKERMREGDRPPEPSEIHEVVDKTIRPLSKALWAAEDSRYPSISVRSLLDASLRSKSLPAGWVVLLWASTSFTALAVPFGVVASAAHITSIALLAYLVWRITPRFLPANLTAALTVISSLSLGIIFTGSTIASSISVDLELTLAPENVVIGAVWMTLVVTGVSAFSGAREMSGIIQRDLESQHTQDLIEKHTLDTLAGQTSREIATQLHGKIQSKLLGIAAALKHNTLNREEAVKELDSVLSALEMLEQQVTAHDSLRKTAPAQERFATLQEGWRGLLTIEINDASEDAFNRALVHRPEIVEIVREGLTNAYRHGRAITAELTCEWKDKRVIIQLKDDGYGPREGDHGLGFTLIEAWSNSQWQLSAAPDQGSLLRVELEMPAAMN